MRGTVSLSEQQQVTEASDSSNSSSTSAFLASSSATELKESAAAPVSPAAHGGVALLSPVPGGLIMPTKGKCMGIPHPRPRVPLKNPKGLSMPVAPGLTSPPIPRKVYHKDCPHTPKPPNCPPPGFSVGKGPIKCADGICSGPIDESWWYKGWQAGYNKGRHDGIEEGFSKGASKGYTKGYHVGYLQTFEPDGFATEATVVLNDCATTFAGTANIHADMATRARKAAAALAKSHASAISDAAAADKAAKREENAAAAEKAAAREENAAAGAAAHDRGVVFVAQAAADAAAAGGEAAEEAAATAAQKPLPPEADRKEFFFNTVQLEAELLELEAREAAAHSELEAQLVAAASDPQAARDPDLAAYIQAKAEYHRIRIPGMANSEAAAATATAGSPPRSCSRSRHQEPPPGAAAGATAGAAIGSRIRSRSRNRHQEGAAIGSHTRSHSPLVDMGVA